MLATDGTWREAEHVADSKPTMIAAALGASLAFTLGIGVFLFVRRMTGALESPLAPLSLALTAGGLVAWSAAVRLRLNDRRVDILAAFVVALFAVACSFPGQRVVDWLVWLAATAAFSLVPLRRTTRNERTGSPSELVLQTLSRSRGTDGCETICGTVLAEFAAGERSSTLHVAFCPPFERIPEVSAEAAAGPDCTVKLAQVLHQGARLEVRLASASTGAERVTIEFAAFDRPLHVD